MSARMKNFLLVALLTLAGCVPATLSPPRPQDNPDPQTVELSATDTGRIVNLRIGDRLVIRLEANPSTGFRWFLPAFIDGFLLRSEGEEYVASNPGVIGGGGRQIFRYRAVQTGQTLLQFEYLSPARQVQSRVQYTVVVR